MAAPTAPGAARIVGSLVAEIETELDGLVARTGDRIRDEIPEFRRVPVDALARAIRGNVQRALTGAAGDGLLALALSPWLPVAVLAAALAFLASARGFQEGDAVPVIATTSTAANLTCIIGGILVFGDALAGGVLLAVQLAAFALVALAALITPAGKLETV